IWVSNRGVAAHRCSRQPPADDGYAIGQNEDGERGMSDRAPMGDLAGRVIIITGAGQGIGRVFARSFAALGCVVIIAEVDLKKAKRVEAEIVREGGRAMALHV